MLAGELLVKIGVANPEELERAIEAAARRGGEAIKREVSSAGGEAAKAGSEAIVDGFKGIGSRIVAVLGLAAVGTALVSAVRQAVSEGITELEGFNRAMRLLEVSGVEVSVGVAEAVKGLSREIGLFSYSQVAAAVAQLVDAGYSLQGAMEVVRNGALLSASSVDVATGSMVELSRSAEALSQVLVTWGLTAEDASRAADVLAQTLISGAGAYEDTAAALAAIGPLARAAGLSMETAAAAFAALSTSGIGATEAAGALRNVLDTLLSPTKEQARLLAALGVEMDSAGRRAKDAEQALRAIIDAVANPQGAQAIAALWGRHTLSVVAALGQAGEAFKRYRDEIAAADGVAQAAAKTMSSTLTGSTQQMRAAIANARAELAEAFTPALTVIYTKVLPGLVTWLNNAVLALSAWIGVIDRGVIAAREFAASTGVVFTSAQLASRAAQLFTELANLRAEAARLERLPLLSDDQLRRLTEINNRIIQITRELARLAQQQKEEDARAKAQAPVAPRTAPPPQVSIPAPATGGSGTSGGSAPKSPTLEAIRRINEEAAILDSKLRALGSSFEGQYLGGIRRLIAEMEKLRGAAKTVEEQSAWWRTYASLLEKASRDTKGNADALSLLERRFDALRARMALGDIDSGGYLSGLRKLLAEAQGLARGASEDALPRVARLVSSIQEELRKLAGEDRVGKILSDLEAELSRIDKLSGLVPGFDAVSARINALRRAVEELVAAGAYDKAAEQAEKLRRLYEQAADAEAAKKIQEVLASIGEGVPQTAAEIEERIRRIEGAIKSLSSVRGAEGVVSALSGELERLRNALPEARRVEEVAGVIDGLNNRLAALAALSEMGLDTAKEVISAIEGAARRLLELGERQAAAELIRQAQGLRAAMSAQAAREEEESWRAALTERLRVIRAAGEALGKDAEAVAREVAGAIADAITEGIRRGYDVSSLLAAYEEAARSLEALVSEREARRAEEEVRRAYEGALASAKRAIEEAKQMEAAGLVPAGEGGLRAMADAYIGAARSLVRASLDFDGELRRSLLDRAAEYIRAAEALRTQAEAIAAASRAAEAERVAQEALSRAAVSIGDIEEHGIGGLERRLEAAREAVAALREALREVERLVGADFEGAVVIRARIEAIEADIAGAAASLEFARGLSQEVRTALSSAIHAALRGDARGAIEAIGDALYKVVVDRMVAAFVGPIADAAASALSGVVSGVVNAGAGAAGSALVGAIGGPLAALVVGLGALLIGGLIGWITGMGQRAGSNLSSPEAVDPVTGERVRAPSASTPSITYRAETTVNINLEGGLDDPAVRAQIREMATEATVQTLRRLGVIK